MARSSWKVPNIILNLNKKKTQTIHHKNTVQNRAGVITPPLIGQTLYISNGLRFIPIQITERHVGFKFGAFALTKKRARLKR